MKIFRKCNSLSVALLLITFLSFSRYSNQVFPGSEQERSHGDMTFSLIHSISFDYLLPGIERVHNLHVLSLLKYYSEDLSFSEFQKALPASGNINQTPRFSGHSRTILLEQICKFQI